jgi:3-phenylpropionate/cinnamic acid dioxygenase small subunit
MNGCGMTTDPPVDYLANFTDEELYNLWAKRTARLKTHIENTLTIFPSYKQLFLEESIDRVEKEMAKRKLPIPGEDTFRDK